MGRYLGVGVDEYTADSLPALEFPVRDVGALQRLLVSFEGDALSNPEEAAVRALLKSLPGSVTDPTQPLVVHWAGHGALSQAVKLRLLASDNDPDRDEGLDIIGDLGSATAQSGSGQILLIVDTCYSGEAVSATDVVASVLNARPPNAKYIWVGVLTSCLPVETARDGLFGSTMLELLTNGPSDPDMKVRWSTQNRMIRGHDLCEALLVEWGAKAQQPQYHGSGISWWMFPNPLFRPDAPEQVVEHLLLAARGGAPESERSWFTGRAAEVDRVVKWVQSGVPGMHVVTGAPGTGKSAIVGRVVSLSNPSERQRLSEEGDDWGHADPGEGSIQAHIHARGLTADRAADLLGVELVRCGLIERQDAHRNASELVGQVQRAVADGAPPPVLVIDGLDEARGEAFSVAEDLLGRLSEHAVVIVSTREISRSDRRGSLIATLAPQGAELDLDDPPIHESGRRDIRDYVAARLSDVSERMDPQAVADHLNREASLADSPFLLARLVADRLSASPIDTAGIGWERHVSGSIGDALDADMASLALGATVDAAATARALLTGLTWGLGAGLPEDEWLCVASVAVGAKEVDRASAAWVLDQLGRYIVQDGQDGVAVYRLVHQSLADHLRAPYRGTFDAPFDPDALPIAHALTGRYAELLKSGLDARAPTYLWRYAWRHAAGAGTAGLELLRAIAADEPLLAPDVGPAAMFVSDVLVQVGRSTEAVALSEEAVDVFRTSAAADIAAVDRLGVALNSLGYRYSEVGRREDAVSSLEDATEVYRALAGENQAALPYLAGTLSNLGVHYAEIGRVSDAVAAEEEAVALYRGLASENPVFVEDLARAVGNLGSVINGIGDLDNALTLTEQSVELYRALAEENPAFLGEFAASINDLGSRYASLGRFEEAEASSQEAVSLYRGLARENPAYLGDVAMALNNLGASYARLGHPNEALLPVEEAVALLRSITVEDRAHQSDLAGALTVLGSTLSEVGRIDDAIPPSEEAVATYRVLADENPAYLSAVAGALNNLSRRYSQQGRPREGTTCAEEAVRIYRQLVDDNEWLGHDLSVAITNLANHYGDSRRYGEAVELLEEAIQRSKPLAQDNPVLLLDLAKAHTSLGAWYSDLGREADGVTQSEEALAIYRALSEHNATFRGDLAGTLNNLARQFIKLGNDTQAVAPAEESVTILRSLAQENPSYWGRLSTALNNLGSAYCEMGRWPDGLRAFNEAVDAAREATEQTPAHSKDLATALNNLAKCYADMERAPEGVPHVEEAVALYRSLAAENPVLLRDLAGALANLARVAGVERGDQVWDEIIDRADRFAKPPLLLMRAAVTTPGDPRAVGWLTAAMDLGIAVQFPIGGLREQARRHRNANAAAFDEAWARLTGAPAPSWLNVDEELVRTAHAWIETQTFLDERDFLLEHPELAAPRADVAVAEALIDTGGETSERYQALRAAAQEQGIEEAYAPLVRMTLAAEFMGSDTAAQRELLAERRDELLDSSLIAIVADGSLKADTPAAQRAGGLLMLAREGDDAEVLDALEDPSRFPALLAEHARRGSATLGLIAAIAAIAARSPSEQADGSFYVAISSSLAGNSEHALNALAQGRALDPDRAQGWISQLAELARQHPSLLELIGALTMPTEDTLRPAEAPHEGHSGAD